MDKVVRSRTNRCPKLRGGKEIQSGGKFLSALSDNLTSEAYADKPFEATPNVSAMAQSAEIQGVLGALSGGAPGGAAIQRAAESPAVLQAKDVRSAMDPFEREANALANAVVQNIGGDSGTRETAPVARPQLKVGGASVQRLSAIDKADGGKTSSGIQMARGGGESLPEVDRKPMEQSFGADFSGVKIHTDSRADALNRSLGARAFTTGKDVFFKRGEYAPGTTSGQTLLAHELTHVIQQNEGPGLQCSGGSPVVQCELAPIAERSIDKAILGGGTLSYNECKDFLERFDVIPADLQESACHFPSAKRNAQHNLDFVRARLLMYYYDAVKNMLDRENRRQEAAEEAGETYDSNPDYAAALRSVQMLVDRLKDRVIGYKVHRGHRITPEVKMRLEGNNIVTGGMNLLGAPVVEVAATKIPNQADSYHAHAYIRYTHDDGSMWKISAHSDGEVTDRAPNGKLKGECVPYGGVVWEYVNRGDSRVVAQGDRARYKLANFRNAVDNLNAKDLNYRIPSQDCNTAARWFLKKAGYGYVRPPNFLTGVGGWLFKIGITRRGP